MGSNSNYMYDTKTTYICTQHDCPCSLSQIMPLAHFDSCMFWYCILFCESALSICYCIHLHEFIHDIPICCCLCWTILSGLLMSLRFCTAFLSQNNAKHFTCAYCITSINPQVQAWCNPTLPKDPCQSIATHNTALASRVTTIIHHSQ